MSEEMYYILDEAGNPQPAGLGAGDILAWAEWYEKADKLVQLAKSEINGVRVSTVFLAINHQWGDGPPLLWETMIFGGEHDSEQWRYSTREEALAGHAAAVAIVKGETN